MLTFLHAADVHLDSPLRGLDRYERPAPVEEIRQATRRAFENVVRLAIDEQVAFMILAGDVYDVDGKDFQTALFFNRQMSRLKEHGIQVYVAAGNHDADARMTKNLARPENVHVFSTRKPQTLTLDDFGVAIHGQGFASQAVTDDLAAAYPAPVPHLFNIGVLHTSLNGREGHANYAPCSIDQLRQKGYDYWALGHVHGRELVLPEDPVILFPGNVQGRHIREEGGKGCSLVTIDQDRVTAIAHRNTDVFRWLCCDIDMTDAAAPEAVLDHFDRKLKELLQEAEGQPLAVRVHVRGTGSVGRLMADRDRWISEIRSAATDIGNGSVWVEKVAFEVAAEPLSTIGQAAEGLLRLIREVPAEALEAAGGFKRVNELAARLESDPVWGGVKLSAEDQRRALIEEGRALLLARLAQAD